MIRSTDTPQMPNLISKGPGNIYRKSCGNFQSPPAGSTVSQSPAEGSKLTSGVTGEIRIPDCHRQPNEERSHVVGITGQATDGTTNLHAPTGPYNRVRCIPPGLGAGCENSTVGCWSAVETTYHINYQKLLAAFLALKTFASQHKGAVLSQHKWSGHKWSGGPFMTA